jgi:hypothetical protein
MLVCVHYRSSSLGSDGVRAMKRCKNSIHVWTKPSMSLGPIWNTSRRRSPSNTSCCIAITNERSAPCSSPPHHRPSLTEKKKLKAHHILKHISFHHDSFFPTTIPVLILVHAWLLLQDHSIQYIIRSSANNNDLRVKLAWPLT